MKRKTYLLLTALVLSLCVFGCDSGENTDNAEVIRVEGNDDESDIEATDDVKEDITDENDEVISGEEVDESFTGMANPWTDLSPEEFSSKSGFEVNVPSDAENVVYRFLEADNLSEVLFDVNGLSYCYRIKPSSSFTDISGLFYDWENINSAPVSGQEGISYEAKDGETQVQLILWYDDVAGVMYSLGQTSGAETPNVSDTSAITAIAETVYLPAQGEVTDDANEDALNEINDYFLGSFCDDTEEQLLEISDNNDGTYNINFAIIRLCNMIDGSAVFEDHKMVFTITDPNGNPMSGIIYRDSDNSLVVKITDSTWTYINTDDEFSGLVREQ